MSSVREIWSLLHETGQVSEGYIRLRVPDVQKCRCYAARNLASGGGVLMFEVGTANIPSRNAIPSGAGFTIEIIPITAGRNGTTRITLEAIDSSYSDVFETLADDVVNHLAHSTTESDAIRTLFHRLAKWQAFLRAFGKKGLTVEQRRGLWGELHFLRQLADAIGWEGSVGAWKGFQMANHDFQCPNCAIEVKTTSASTPSAFRVSNVRQLDDSGIDALFLALIMVEETESGGKSLPEIIAAIREQLTHPGRAAFDDGLLEAGYVDSHAAQYVSPRYIEHGIKWFHVRDGFPRILGASLQTGIEDVRYSVAIAACKDFEIPVINAFNRIMSGYVG